MGNIICYNTEGGVLGVLRKIKVENLQHFFVERWLTAEGEDWSHYDSREPGCILALSKGYEFLMKRLRKNTPLTLDHLLDLHN